MKEDWEKRLDHARWYRDMLVEMGNTPPSQPDPYGSLYLVTPRTWTGKIYKRHLERDVHSHLKYEDCKCSRKTP